jgi:hypothetical protein
LSVGSKGKVIYVNDEPLGMAGGQLDLMDSDDVEGMCGTWMGRMLLIPVCNRLKGLIKDGDKLSEVARQATLEMLQNTKPRVMTKTGRKSWRSKLKRK